MKRLLILLALFVGVACAASAQSAEILTGIVREEKSTWKSLTYLAYYTDSDNAESEDISLEGVVAALMHEQQRTDLYHFENAPAIRYDDMSLFLLKAFDVKVTSAMYYCFENRHYAFRQMKYFGIIQSSVFPTDNMTGSFFVTIMGKFSDKFPNAKLTTNTKGAF